MLHSLAASGANSFLDIYLMTFLSADMNLSKSDLLVSRPSVMRKEEDEHSGFPSDSIT